jgi:hypothetical protein
MKSILLTVAATAFVATFSTGAFAIPAAGPQSASDPTLVRVAMDDDHMMRRPMMHRMMRHEMRKRMMRRHMRHMMHHDNM